MLRVGARSYCHVESILEHGLDRAPVNGTAPATTTLITPSRPIAQVRVAYRRRPRLLEELALVLVHADGTYTRLIGRLAKVDVLVLDDCGLAPLRDQERRDMLEIVDDGHGARSTVLTSQLPAETGTTTLEIRQLQTLLDRVVHNAHRIKLKCSTRRKPGR